MLLFCDDECQTIKLDDKIIYKKGYVSEFKGSNTDYFNFPEFDAEPGQIIKILVQDEHPTHLKLCGKVNIDGYIFTTNFTNYWYVDGNPAQNFYNNSNDGYFFNCIGIETEEHPSNLRNAWFDFKIPSNIEKSNYVSYEKQYNCEDLTFYIKKGESVEFDLSHFIGNKKIKFIHPVKFKFENLIGNLIYLNDDSNVINEGVYSNYKFKYIANNTNERYYDIIEYYVFKYNQTIDSDTATIIFNIYDENNIYIVNTDCPENQKYILKGNRKECYVDCPQNYPYLIEGTKECVKFCTFPNIYLDEDNKKCVESCKKINKYFDPYLRKCLNQCPREYFQKYNDETKECMAECQGNTNYTVHEYSDACVHNCFPTDTYHYTDNKNECKMNCNWIDLITNKCISNCNNYYYVDDKNNKFCTNNCLHYIDEMDDKKCLINCTKFMTQDNKCSTSCEEFYYFKNNKKYCVSRCNDTQFIDEDGKTCVNTCLNFKNIKLKKCVHYINDCNGMFIIEDKKECVEKCEFEPYIFINDEKNYCESEDSCRNKNYGLYKGKCIKNCPKYYKNINGYCKLDCINIDDEIIDCKKNKTILIDLISLNLNELIDNKKNIKGENVDIKIIKNNEKLEENPNYKTCLNNLNISDYIILKINLSNKSEFKLLYLNGKESDS